MYVKEDLIIPHTVSFYDLIVQKARGKSGPLFHFDVHEDIRMQSDATVEKDESHAGGAPCTTIIHWPPWLFIDPCQATSHEFLQAACAGCMMALSNTGFNADAPDLPGH